MVGVIYIGFPLNFLYRIRLEMGPFYLYFLFAVIFLGDTGAFFIGKPFGRHKMTPIASPNKTWEGAPEASSSPWRAAALARALAPARGPARHGPPDRGRRPRRGPGQRSAGVPLQAGRRGQGLLQRPARARRLLRPDRQPDPGRPAVLFHRPVLLEVGLGTRRRAASPSSARRAPSGRARSTSSTASRGASG
ncbi:MAG: phosphatidate cytidylyltransferase [Candidatus Moduliflexus flocculans]|nr:phosphatidate cytidylyltransferase [Candidatus Moduliflexus flocculans]